MAVFYGAEMTKLRVDPITVPNPGFVDGTLRVFQESVTLATQTTADTIEIARLPKGAVFLYGSMVTTTSLGSATIAIGITGTTGKYRAAATFTTTTAPEFFGVTNGIGSTLSDEEIVIITIATASLPGSGTLKIGLYYVFN